MGISLEHSITTDRLKSYLIKSGYNKEKAIKLYGWNICICSAFYPSLNALEVALRNVISTQIIKKYGDNWWTDNSFLTAIREGKNNIKHVIKNITKTKKIINSSNIIKNLTFGFWVKMLLPKHQKEMWGNQKNIFFPNIPNTISNDELYNILDKICSFRNRIFHCGKVIHINISQMQQDIFKVINWISSEKLLWIKQYCNVHTIMRIRPK